MRMGRWVLLSLLGVQFLGGLNDTFASTDDERLLKTAGRINRFGWKLFEAAAKIEEIVKDNKQGLLFSPVSAYYAYGLLANGASGTSQIELATHLSPEFEGLGTVGFEEKHLKELNTDLKSFSNYLKTTMGQSEALSMANRIWTNNEVGTVVPSYADRVENSFAAFRGNEVVISKSFEPVSIAGEINSWVHTETLEMIDEVVTPDEFTANTAFALVNALVYQGKWPNVLGYDRWNADPAKPDELHTFKNKGGESTTLVDLFTPDATTYAKHKNFDAVSLPLASLLTDKSDETVVGQYTVDFVRANEDSSNILSYQTYMILVNMLNQNAISPPAGQKIKCHIPVANLRSNIDLKLTMAKGLGLETIFDEEAADFKSMMTPKDKDKKIFVKFAKQVAVLEVDEFGIKAAASTVISGNVGANVKDPPTVIFSINSPYFIAIRDTKTNAVLMLAAVDSLAPPAE